MLDVQDHQIAKFATGNSVPPDNIMALAVESYKKIVETLQKRIVGMSEVVEQLLLAIFSGHHALLVGVPGLAKTLLIRSIADLMVLKFTRIQFTPDLMPSDITGTEVLAYDEQSNTRQFTFLPGPLFANIILADEINRTPPKTQSALLEAMEEKTVTALGQKFSLELPFLVLATQNPIEQEGTYPLPIAQLDRFMFNILVDYPNAHDEHQIMRKSLRISDEPLEPIFQKDDFLQILYWGRKINISSHIRDYAVKLCRATRPQHPEAPNFIRNLVAWGVSPRATQYLILAAKTRAMLHGRKEVELEDIVEIVHPIFRHRILMHYRAEAENIGQDDIISLLLQEIPTPNGIEIKISHRKYAKHLYFNRATNGDNENHLEN